MQLGWYMCLGVPPMRRISGLVLHVHKVSQHATGALLASKASQHHSVQPHMRPCGFQPLVWHLGEPFLFKALWHALAAWLPCKTSRVPWVSSCLVRIRECDWISHDVSLVYLPDMASEASVVCVLHAIHARYRHRVVASCVAGGILTKICCCAFG